MRRLQIKNIGPISFVDMGIKRINVIIGPQSSGKSTIAKILSFCLWLEKDIVAHQEKEYIDSKMIQKELLDYHKIGNYLNEGASIIYEGEYINFTFRSVEDFSVSLTDGFPKAVMSKVGYIPAERNLTAINNISGLTMDKDYVRDYLFDWLNLHVKYDWGNEVTIPDQRVKYYFNNENKSDVIQLENGKELSISEVSSGLQSLVPMFVSFKYITSWVFEHDEGLSYDKNSVLTKALIRALSPDFDEEKVNQALQFPTVIEKLKSSLESILNERFSDLLTPELKSIAQLRNRIIKPHYACLIVEEPEQNLFPKTQVVLIYELLRMLSRKDDLLLMTTHSPYTLYALNNCILGFKVKDSIDDEEKKALLSYHSWTNGDNVAIWQVTDQGTLTDLKEPSTGLVGKHYFNDVMNETLDEYHTMIDFLD